MANKQKGEVALVALSKEWILKFSTNALCELEDLTGKSAIEVANSMNDESKVTMKLLRQIVFAGLSENNPSPTIEDAGNIIDSVGFDVIGPKIAEAFILAFPAPEDGEAPNEGKTKQAS